MIKIEKAESYRICSHCYSKNDVMNINIRYQCTNTGTQITLCKECCESMVNEIRRVDLNSKAAAVKDEDAVPVVRCKDCKMFYMKKDIFGEVPWCKTWHKGTIETMFCGWGKRKDGNHNE